VVQHQPIASQGAALGALVAAADGAGGHAQRGQFVLNGLQEGPFVSRVGGHEVGVQRAVRQQLAQVQSAQLQGLLPHLQAVAGERCGFVGAAPRQAQREPGALRQQRCAATAGGHVQTVHTGTRHASQPGQGPCQGLRQRPAVFARQAAALQRKGQVDGVGARVVHGFRRGAAAVPSPAGPVPTARR
jgi:hypothetical protein